MMSSVRLPFLPPVSINSRESATQSAGRYGLTNPGIACTLACCLDKLTNSYLSMRRLDLHLVCEVADLTKQTEKCGREV
jgi:hypothetical protein